MPIDEFHRKVALCAAAVEEMYADFDQEGASASEALAFGLGVGWSPVSALQYLAGGEFRSASLLQDDPRYTCISRAAHVLYFTAFTVGPHPDYAIDAVEEVKSFLAKSIGTLARGDS